MDPWLETFARANFRRSADTAHDLKTPLNVAVLNLELLRMRLRKLVPDEDEKIAGYAQAIDVELRRLGRIFDAFFLLSTPPKTGELPAPVDVAAIAEDSARTAGLEISAGSSTMIKAHEPRIRQAFKLFFEGAPKLFRDEGRQITAGREDGDFAIRISGVPDTAELELTKIFKLYYTDPQGNPDFSLAVARLIAETYGGELKAVEDRDKVILRFSFPWESDEKSPDR